MTSRESRVTSHGKRTPELALVGVLLLSDQLTKYFFSGSSGFYCNPVGPWGISADNGVLIVAMIAVLFGAWYLFFSEAVFFRDSSASLGMTACGGASCHMAFALLFSGGFSNLLDRILFGCVRDFALIQWFPAFNLADVYLTIGTIVFLFAFFLQRKNPRK